MFFMVKTRGLEFLLHLAKRAVAALQASLIFGRACIAGM